MIIGKIWLNANRLINISNYMKPYQSMKVFHILSNSYNAINLKTVFLRGILRVGRSEKLLYILSIFTK